MDIGGKETDACQDARIERGLVRYQSFRTGVALVRPEGNETHSERKVAAEAHSRRRDTTSAVGETLKEVLTNGVRREYIQCGCCAPTESFASFALGQYAAEA